MDDLVKRLREAAQWQFKTEPTLYGEAADRIEELRIVIEWMEHLEPRLVEMILAAVEAEKKNAAT
jgi:hypothetical protein